MSPWKHQVSVVSRTELRHGWSGWGCLPTAKVFGDTGSQVYQGLELHIVDSARSGANSELVFPAVTWSQDPIAGSRW